FGTREVDWHSHLRGQIFCVDSGLMHVRTRHGSWILPPHRAGWIPPGEMHSATISGVMSGWFVLVAPACCADL
ncbi:AraC family ligand binding domain-containing protein, partial [Providencia rettgeri]